DAGRGPVAGRTVPGQGSGPASPRRRPAGRRGLSGRGLATRAGDPRAGGGPADDDHGHASSPARMTPSPPEPAPGSSAPSSRADRPGWNPAGQEVRTGASYAFAGFAYWLYAVDS